MYWRRARHRPITSGEVSPDTTTHWWPSGARGSYTHAQLLALGLALDFRPRDRQPWHLAEHPSGSESGRCLLAPRPARCSRQGFF
eukprot:scaffold36279_cov98-Isochrysis_galbana.AAC.1